MEQYASDTFVARHNNIAYLTPSLPQGTALIRILPQGTDLKELKELIRILPQGTDFKEIKEFIRILPQGTALKLLVLFSIVFLSNIYFYWLLQAIYSWQRYTLYKLIFARHI